MAGDDRRARLRGLVIFLFFAWGFTTVLVDILVPKFKSLFSLNYAEVMLTQFSFFLGYFLFSLPAAWLLARLGYIRSAVLGLSVMAGGCLLFVPAAALALYPAFLVALFVMAAGITLLQVTANPLITLLGTEETSASRLTLAQAFNSLGTAVGPWFGAATILHGQAAQGSAASLQIPFVLIAIILILVASVFWLARQGPAPAAVPQPATASGMKRLVRRSRLMLGVGAIFTYVGAEVTIGATLASYLMQPSVLGLPAQRAGQMVSLYWGAAMLGRFAGAYVLKRVNPGLVLACCALGAIALVLSSAVSPGLVAAMTLLAVGLCNSIMFPTIFALASEGLGVETPNGSGLLCMAIVGGAIVPLLFGLVADRAGIGVGLAVPALCYLWVLFFGVFAARQRCAPASHEAP